MANENRCMPEMEGGRKRRETGVEGGRGEEREGAKKGRKRRKERNGRKRRNGKKKRKNMKKRKCKLFYKFDLTSSSEPNLFYRIFFLGGL